MTRSTGSRVGVQHRALVFLGSMLLIAACHKTAATPVVCIPRVRIVKVVQRDVPLYREWIGTLDGFVNAEVKAQVAGYIRKQVYQEGTFVRQGELLFLVDPGNHRDVRLNHQWTQVTSPIEGIAGVAQVRVSNLVNASTLLTTVSQVDPIKVQFNISEMEYVGSANGNHWAESGGSGLSPLELILQNGTVHPHRGAVIVVNHQINSQTGTIALTGSFPNPGEVLRPGQYAKVRAAVVIRQSAILVPQRAVNEIQGSYQIAVVGADGKLQIRSVATGEQIGAWLIITQGVRAGEKVIVSDLARLAPGMAVCAVSAHEQ